LGRSTPGVKGGSWGYREDPRNDGGESQSERGCSRPVEKVSRRGEGVIFGSLQRVEGRRRSIYPDLEESDAENWDVRRTGTGLSKENQKKKGEDCNKRPGPERSYDKDRKGK